MLVSIGLSCVVPPLRPFWFSSLTAGAGPMCARLQYSLASGRVDVVAAARILEVVERPHLAGHLERVAIDGIVPALDVDGAGPACEAQLGDDVGPVAVAEAGRAHEDERHLAENAVLAD